MKIKIGPVEVEQDSLKDEVLFEEYKKTTKRSSEIPHRKKQIFLILL